MSETRRCFGPEGEGKGAAKEKVEVCVLRVVAIVVGRDEGVVGEERKDFKDMREGREDEISNLTRVGLALTSFKSPSISFISYSCLVASLCIIPTVPCYHLANQLCPLRPSAAPHVPHNAVQPSTPFTPLPRAQDPHRLF
jgi:hypothetical protein